MALKSGMSGYSNPIKLFRRWHSFLIPNNWNILLSNVWNSFKRIFYKFITFLFVSNALENHRNKNWKHTSPDNKVIGDYEIKEWKNSGEFIVFFFIKSQLSNNFLFELTNFTFLLEDEYTLGSSGTSFWGIGGADHSNRPKFYNNLTILLALLIALITNLKLHCSWVWWLNE